MFYLRITGIIGRICGSEEFDDQIILIFDEFGCLYPIFITKFQHPTDASTIFLYETYGFEYGCDRFVPYLGTTGSNIIEIQTQWYTRRINFYVVVENPDKYGPTFH